MKKKLTILAFGLLLAVGWTNDASAQLLPNAGHYSAESATPRHGFATKQIQKGSGNDALAQQLSLNSRAPKQTQNYDLNASATHTKAWFEALDPVTWDGGSQSITEPFTTAKGMIALVKRVYMDKDIPGAKYNAPRNCDIPYQTIQHGWDIIGTNYLDPAYIYTNSNSLVIFGIYVLDANGDVINSFEPSNSTSLSGWSVGYNNGYYYMYASSSSGAGLTVPASWMENSTGYADVVVDVYALGQSDSLRLGNQTYGFYQYKIPYSNEYYPYYTFPGTITPPTENGYTPLLVKLKDGINSDPDVLAPWETYSTQELEDYFTTYVDEIQLLTDGLRVGTGTADAGTVFAYTGDLNRFFFIGKGKMFYYSALDSLEGYDRTPFYSMYEEFSANDVTDETGFTDFYEKMKQGETYPILHDCMGVIYRQHYFSMAGKQGTTVNRVNSLVFYIPDNRGVLNSEWREYDPEHLPSVGMYMVDLYADIEPSTTPDYYTVTVTWQDNLGDLTNDDNIPQTYYLYQIIGNDTTCVTPYGTSQTTWTYDYPVGDPTAYDISYYVIATPTDATNKDVFFAKSNTDDVTVPGNSDFIGLQWWRYESDYVTNDGTNQEVNYYRNFLAPHALSVQGQAGISAGNVGTTGRTLTLYREDTPIIDLELVMSGNKAYYRIKYRNRNENQQVEPGYDPNTGELLNSNN